jgi:polyphosphate kinase
MIMNDELALEVGVDSVEQPAAPPTEAVGTSQTGDGASAPATVHLGLPVPEEATAEPPTEPAVDRDVPQAVVAQPIPAGAPLNHPSLYFNQELSWIDFNWRVLHLALDERTPLLERVRFVAITASNLDEFIQKRVGGLKRQEAAGVRSLSPDGRTPSEQLRLLREAIREMQGVMTETWEKSLKPELWRVARVAICDYEQLSQAQKAALHEYFRAQVYPILTPLTVDPGHPFPFISNLSLSLAVILRHPLRGTLHFARLKVPTSLGRWLSLNDLAPDVTPRDGRYFLPVEQLIASHAADLFHGMEVLSVQSFRITRNADLRRNEEEAEDLLAMISEELRERRFAPVVRVEVAQAMPEYDRRLLIRELGLRDADIYEVDGLMDLTGCFDIVNLNLPHLKDEPWEPVVPARLLYEGETDHSRDIFAIIRQGDLLVHHPYESFAASVQRLIEEAAADSRVLAIKQTLYRTSDESPVVEALRQAAEAGKQVAVLIEVKARFDEASNIEWGQMLENAGVHVAYGLVGLKTHAKATLIVRQERDGLRTYCHIGTGNYHPKTARLYTDLGLLTCDSEIGRDVVNLFHSLTGYAPYQPYQRVMVAPRNMRRQFNRLIRQEIQNQCQYGTGRIIAKMNALDDVGIIKRLYLASQNGVQVDLIIRGHSRLRPGLPGYSDNIRVISILGRFLEHDRIFYFHNNGQPKLFIGSADWRGRNLRERVELITPIEQPELKQRLIDLLADAMADNRLAWDLDGNGRYRLRRPADDESERNIHDILMRQARRRAKESRSP